MTNKKMMLVPAALILALFASAFTYGLWFQTLTVDGVVETGELDWEIVNQFTSDPFETPDLNIAQDFTGQTWYPEGKHVGASTCEIARDGKSVTFSITNAYPGYFVMCSVYFLNTGTVPIHFENIEFRDCQDNLLYNYSYPETSAPKMFLDLDGDCVADIGLWWREPLGAQYHPGDDSFEYSFWIVVLQTASEDTCYCFEMWPTAVQWNESDWPMRDGSPT
jgi:hypothetical protein